MGVGVGGGSKILEKKYVGEGQKILILEWGFCYEEINYSRGVREFLEENEKNKKDNHSIKITTLICFKEANVL